jgi:putative ABC transport system permease protein
MHGLWQDARYGLRLLRREPGFTAVAVLTIALGVSASTTLFSVTYGVLLRPLPWHQADRLVRVSESRSGHAPRIPGTVTNGSFLAWRAQRSTIEDIGGWRNVPITATIGSASDPVRIQATTVTPSLFTVLKTPPLRGRLFVDDDAVDGVAPQAKNVVILSYGLWQESFGGRDDAIGGVVRVGDQPYSVVGVMPKGFAVPDRETRAWTPWAVPST